MPYMNRKAIILSLSLFAIAIISFVAAYSYENYFGPKTVLHTNEDKAHCRQGNVLEGVNRQARFTVLSTCEQAVGIVYNMTGIKKEDGDYQFNLAVQKPYKKLLNEENIKQVQGMLVVEIIPIDQNSSSVQIPKNGDKIEGYGAWVTDNPKGWNELHPAWNITIL
jgi:hypothetical protein